MTVTDFNKCEDFAKVNYPGDHKVIELLKASGSVVEFKAALIKYSLGITEERIEL